MKFSSTISMAALLWIVGAPVFSQADTSYSKLNPGTVSVGNMVLIEDDIFVGRSGSTDHLQRGLSISNALSAWPDGIVPYEIDSNVSQQGREIVEAAIAHWNTRSSITLIDRNTAEDAGDDYVRFITGPGCASWVGRQGGAQEVWVSDYCTTGSMIHEVGHALGLLHEHTRSDRDQFIQVIWNNVQADKAFNFEISNAGASELGPYDYGSVMHYGEYFFSNNGEKTLVPIGDVGTAEIGQRVEASAGDLNAIDRLYQTDLAVAVVHTAGQAESTVDLTVSNLGTQGAHNLVITVTGAGDVSEFSGVAGWQCSTVNDALECTLDRLASSAIASVTLVVSTDVVASDIAVTLRSKTFDHNMANNDGSGSGTELAPALGDDRTVSAASAGSIDYLYLALLMLLLLNRCFAVIAFTKSNQNEPTRDAYSSTATPSG